jgi:glutathione S-transferase
MQYLYPIFAKIPGRVVTDEEKLERFSTVVNYLNSFEEELKSRKTSFLGGDQPCMADYMIWPIYERIEGLPILLGSIGQKFVIPSHLENVLEWIKVMRNTEPVKSYGFSPARMAKITEIHHQTDGYDDAMKASEGL